MGTVKKGSAFYLGFMTFEKLNMQWERVSHLMISEDKPFSCLDSAHWQSDRRASKNRFPSRKPPAQGEGSWSSENHGVGPHQILGRVVFCWLSPGSSWWRGLALPPSQELGCSYADVAAQDGEAVLRAILASQQPNRCKRAQAFISTQDLRPDTVAELVAEEVTRELLTPSEGTGALLPGLPGLSDHTLQLPTLRNWFMFMYILYAVLYARLHLKENTPHLFSPLKIFIYLFIFGRVGSSLLRAGFF